MELLLGMGFTQHQIDRIGPGVEGGLNAWVDASLAEAEEELLGKDPAVYAAEMSAPYVKPHDETLCLDFIDFAGTDAQPLVTQLAAEVEKEFRLILTDYGVEDPPVTVQEFLEDNTDGSPRRTTSVAASSDESTLDLLHDNVLDVMAPKLRQRLNSNGYERIHLHVLFSSLSQWM